MKSSDKNFSTKESPLRYDPRRLNPSQRNVEFPKLNVANRESYASAFQRKKIRRLSNSIAFGKPASASTENSPGTWWIHLWSGLVRDPTAKHHSALRHAIWLYLYFLVVANWKNGTLMRRISTIATETGFNPRSINRWLRILRSKGYINTRSNGRALWIAITKWRVISRRGGSKHEDGS